MRALSRPPAVCPPDIPGSRAPAGEPLSEQSVLHWRGLCFFAGKSVFDSSIRHEPNKCNQYV